jgi:hypothetical protein
MDLRNLRLAPGPYRSGFDIQGYYDPREDGPVLAALNEYRLGEITR